MSCNHGVSIGEYCPVCDVADETRPPVVRIRPPLRHVYFTTMPVKVAVPPDSGARGLEPHTHPNPFRPHWLIVTTPGFDLTVVFQNRKVLRDVDGDMYLPGMWDRLEREGQLARVVFDVGPMGTGNYLIIEARRRTSKSPEFRAGIIGRELVT